MKVTFMVGLTYIVLEEDLKPDFLIGQGLYLTNDKNFIENLINPNFIKIAGQMEANFLKESVIIYSVEDVEEDGFIPQSYLINKLKKVDFFLTLSWLVKDNNIDFENGFIEYYKKDSRYYLDVNTLAHQYSCSNGINQNIIFSKQELESIRLFEEGYGFEIVKHEETYQTLSQKDFLRLARALNFLQISRSYHDLGLKIANYCTAFECLFSTATTELTYRLSERIAFFLGKTTEDRKDIFNVIKKAYAFRSSVVHGDVIKKVNELGEVSEKMDDCLRKTLTKIFEEDDIDEILTKTNNDIDNYFNDLIFKIS